MPRLPCYQLLVLLLTTAACAAPDAPATLTVAKPTGARQCQGGGTPLPAVARQLSDGGVPVLASRCGNDGLMHPMVCGAADGSLALVDISAAQLGKAQALGFQPLTQWPDAQPAPCPAAAGAATR